MVFVDPESSEGAWSSASLRQDITIVPDTRLDSIVPELRTFAEQPDETQDVAALVRGRMNIWRDAVMSSLSEIRTDKMSSGLVSWSPSARVKRFSTSWPASNTPSTSSTADAPCNNSSFEVCLTFALRPRRFTILPSADACKRLLGQVRVSLSNRDRFE
jgi:hypothetical protein